MSEQATAPRARSPHYWWLGSALPALLLLALLAARVVDASVLETLRVQAFDSYQQYRPRPPGNNRVVIVDIDEQSLRSIGQWPWPRNLLANLVAALNEAGAAIIGFNVLFAEADRLSPGRYAELYPWLDPALRRRLGALPSNDRLLADSFAGVDVVLGIGLSGSRTVAPSAKGVAPQAAMGGPADRTVNVAAVAQPFLPHYAAVLGNVAELTAQSRGQGVVSLGLERDGIVRRVPGVVGVVGGYLPALSVEMLRLDRQAVQIDVTGSVAGVLGFDIAGQTLESDGAGNLWIYYGDRDSVARLPAADVLAGNFSVADVAGKLVLVGATAAGLGDFFPTPTGVSLAGVEVQAQLLQSIADQQLLRRPAYAVAIEVLITLLVGLITIFFWRRLMARWGLILLVATMAALAAGAWLSFATSRLLLDPTFPVLSIMLLYVVLVSQGFVRERWSRRRMAERSALERADREARLRALQAELAAVSQASALGEMATAIAHEINQPLGAVINYIDAGRLQLADAGHLPTDPVAETMDKALAQATRAGAIMKDLRQTLGKKETPRRGEALNSLVEEAATLALSEAADRNIETTFDLVPGIPDVRVNRIQLQQVVFNLVRNSLDATLDATVARIVVSTQGGSDGNVCISVRDNGPGIDPAVADRLFQPFATTKETGTGIGLSICKTIIEAHGGAIAARNEDNGGATFSIFLPIDDAKDDDDRSHV